MLHLAINAITTRIQKIRRMHILELLYVLIQIWTINYDVTISDIKS